MHEAISAVSLPHDTKTSPQVPQMSMLRDTCTFIHSCLVHFKWLTHLFLGVCFISTWIHTFARFAWSICSVKVSINIH